MGIDPSPSPAASPATPLRHPGGSNARVAIEIVLLGARRIADRDDALAMLRHPIPTAFWETLRGDGLIPREAPTP